MSPRRRRLPPAPAPVQVRFDAEASRYRPAAGETGDDYAAGAAQVQLRGRAAGDIVVENTLRRAQGDVTLYLPLAITGLSSHALPSNPLLWADRAMVSLSDGDGRVVWTGRGDDLKRDGGRAYETVRIPALTYEAAKDRPLRLQIDYSLSVLNAQPPVSAPGARGRREPGRLRSLLFRSRQRRRRGGVALPAGGAGPVVSPRAWRTRRRASAIHRA